MINNEIGNVYRFPLNYNKGFGFAEVLDYTDISTFDGLLIKVYDYFISNIDDQISFSDIIKKPVLIKPIPISKNPKSQKRKGWVFLKENIFERKEDIIFKDLRAITQNNDWSSLSPWFKYNFHTGVMSQDISNYEEIRHLERTILNHIDTIAVKATMMFVLKNNGDIRDYYDLKQLGNRNVLSQLINTYFDSIACKNLLKKYNLISLLYRPL